MFCKNCGKEIDDGATFCPHCGASQGSTPPPQQKVVDPNDKSSFGFALLGFLIPLVGLILFLVWKDSMPRRAHSCGKGALVAVILYVILWIIMMFVMCGIAGAAMSSLPAAVVSA